MGIAKSDIDLARAAPEFVHLMPIGRFTPRDGRAAWLNPSPANVVMASRAAAIDLVIDYEHQTDNAPDNGQPAPAAGWIKGLETRPDGIWGKVEWTDKARAMIEAGEYRFLSPVFMFEKATREVQRILRAALTNNPALNLKAIAKNEGDDALGEFTIALAATELSRTLNRAIEAAMQGGDISRADLLSRMAEAAGIDEGTVNQILNGDIERPPDRRLQGFARVLDVSFDALKQTLPSASASNEEDDMKELLKALAKALGLSEDSDQEKIMARVSELHAADADHGKAMTAVARALDIEGDADSDGLVAAIATLKAPNAGSADDPDPAKFVKVEDFNNLATELATMKKSTATEKATAAVDDAVKAGKLVPAQRAWAIDLATKDAAGFNAFIENQPAVLGPGGTPPGGSPPQGGDGLTADELAVCRAMNLTPEDFKKSREQLEVA